MGLRGYFIQERIHKLHYTFCDCLQFSYHAQVTLRLILLNQLRLMKTGLFGMLKSHEGIDTQQLPSTSFTRHKIAPSNRKKLFEFHDSSDDANENEQSNNFSHGQGVQPELMVHRDFGALPERDLKIDRNRRKLREKQMNPLLFEAQQSPIVREGQVIPASSNSYAEIPPFVLQEQQQISKPKFRLTKGDQIEMNGQSEHSFEEEEHVVNRDSFEHDREMVIPGDDSLDISSVPRDNSQPNMSSNDISSV